MLGCTHADIPGKNHWKLDSFRDIAKSTEMFEQQQGNVRYNDRPLKARSDKLICVEFMSNPCD